MCTRDEYIKTDISDGSTRMKHEIFAGRKGACQGKGEGENVTSSSQSQAFSCYH